MFVSLWLKAFRYWWSAFFSLRLYISKFFINLFYLVVELKKVQL